VLHFRLGHSVQILLEVLGGATSTAAEVGNFYVYRDFGGTGFHHVIVDDKY